jgi:hypothetical protein
MDQNNNKKVLLLTINGKQFEWHRQYITGAEIRELGHIPNDFEIFLAIKEPGENEIIKNEDKVDLARPGIEHFFSRKADWKLVIDTKPFDWKKQYITGSEVRSLGNIASEYQIFLVIKGPFEDELIENSEKVDLARPGIEHFYSCKPNTNNG